MIPAHVTQTLDGLCALRAQLDDAIRVLSLVYAPGVSAVPPPSQPGSTREGVDVPAAEVAPEPSSGKRPRRPRAVRQEDEAEATDEAGVVEGKYDAVIRRALRDAGEIGLPAIDIAVAWLPNRYTAADKSTALAGVYAALKSFERRGQVTKDGRIWKWVQA